jgi:hypothetical protein
VERGSRDLSHKNNPGARSWDQVMVVERERVKKAVKKKKLALAMLSLESKLPG